ncbi:hypothetical protein BDW22DRAFT_1359960 [Trametopsis cervina]|nr:hypothetical protein BDW22DRAFT_1359960 [Trametopsis cervina]
MALMSEQRNPPLHPLTSTEIIYRRSIHLDDLERGEIIRETGPPLLVKVTGYRLLNTSILLGLGTWKAVASYRNKAIVSTSLDLILGVVLAIILYWLGLLETVQSPPLRWLFEYDYGELVYKLRQPTAPSQTFPMNTSAAEHPIVRQATPPGLTGTLHDNDPVTPQQIFQDLSHALYTNMTRVPEWLPLVVPQELYVSPSARDWSLVKQSPPISFLSSAHGPHPFGISLQDALENNCPEEWYSDKEQFFEQSVTKIICRINWPGYPPETKLASVKTFSRDPKPVNKAKLAQNVAGAVARALYYLERQRQVLPGYKVWAIGDDVDNLENISPKPLHSLPKDKLFNLENIFLASLHRVSQGSWQPKLYFLHNDPDIMELFWLSAMSEDFGEESGDHSSQLNAE